MLSHKFSENIAKYKFCCRCVLAYVKPKESFVDHNSCTLPPRCSKLRFCRAFSFFFFPLYPMKPLAYLKRRMRYGFTLIELLLVIGIIAILASIVIVAINPTKQLGDARNAQRRSDVNTILNAVYQYAIDNNGTLPTTITTTSTEICASGNTACSDINLDVLTGTQLIALPADPQNATATGTNYFIHKSGSRIIVSAPAAEQSATIAVTR